MQCLNFIFTYGKNIKIAKFLSQLGKEKMQKTQNAYLNLVWKKHKNRKKPISIRYEKNEKIAKCLSQLGMEKRKNVKMPISIRYGKTHKSQNVYLNYV